jgi:SAM-dependent methyltransferase
MSSKTTAPEEVPTPDAVTDLLFGVYKAALIKAGLELEVWAKVAAGQRTAHDMAQNEGWDPTGTRMLLDAFCGMGLVGKDKDGYHLVPVAELYLLPDKPTYIGQAVLADLAWEGRGQLADAVRSGKRPVISGLTSEEKAFVWSGWYAGRRVAPERGLEDFDGLWQALNIEAIEGLRVLDAACGTGIKTLALARHHPGVRVTLLDWPSVLEAAMDVAGKLGVSDQVATLLGDLQAVDYGQNQFDVVWFGNITHYFRPEKVIKLLRKAYAALVSGGTMVINAPVADEARCEREYPLVGAMEMFVCSAEGDVYTLSEYRGFLEQAGFIEVAQVGELLIKAAKP